MTHFTRTLKERDLLEAVEPMAKRHGCAVDEPAPLLQWSAIVHDDGTEINVTTGRREELLDKLREFAGPAPHTAVGQHLERCAREIEEAPEKVPIFSIDPVSACLEFVTERDIEKERHP